MSEKDPIVNWGDIPEGGTVPSGTYRVKIHEIERTQTREAKKLMYSAEYRTQAPKALKGQPIYDNFVVGNDDDADATDPETWKSSIGAKNLKRLFKAAGVDVLGGRKVSKMIADAVGQVVLIGVSETKETKGDYKGRMRNNVNGYYADGTKEPGLDEEDRAGSDNDDDEPKGKRAVAKDDDEDEAPAQKKRPARDEDDEEEPAPKRKATNGKAPTEDDDDDAPKKGKAKLKKPIECSLCHEQIERSELESHLDKVHADE